MEPGECFGFCLNEGPFLTWSEIVSEPGITSLLLAWNNFNPNMDK